jgi:hypothetical protein
MARNESVAGKLGIYKLGEIMTDSVASGFVGLRYGHSIFQGQVIEDMSFIGLLVELRGSPLDGLRFYYDIWPETKGDAEAGAVHFDGSRVVFGWSFGLDLSTFIDRVDIVPKIGRWSVKALFREPLPTGVGSEDITFEVKNSLSLGLEAGIEKELSPILARGWMSRDFGYNPLQKGATTTVTNTRAGLDALIRGPSYGLFGRPVNLSFLVFGFYENVALEKDLDEADPAVIVIDRIEYDVGYLGGGIALSW